MESEDIIATQPDTQNFEEDNKKSLILNGTLLSDTQTSAKSTLGLTNVTSSTEINNNRASALIVLFFRSFINGHEESKRTINNIYIFHLIINIVKA